MTTTSSTARFVCLFLGGVLGGAFVGAFAWANWCPHYHEDETFFRGKIGDKEVLGIYYHEYPGLGLMDPGRWKVVLGFPGDGGSLILYQKKAWFQEAIPHRSMVEIRDGNRVLIDDGEDKLSVIVETSGEMKRGE